MSFCSAKRSRITLRARSPAQKRGWSVISPLRIVSSWNWILAPQRRSHDSCAWYRNPIKRLRCCYSGGTGILSSTWISHSYHSMRRTSTCSNRHWTHLLTEHEPQINRSNDKGEKPMDERLKYITDNFDNQIYFLKTDSPKISFLDTFREIQKNKIVILTNKKRKSKLFF